VKARYTPARHFSRRAALTSAAAATVLSPALSVPQAGQDADPTPLGRLLTALDSALKQAEAAMDRLAHTEAEGETTAAEEAEAAAAARADALCMEIAAVPSQSLADVASKLRLAWQLQTGRWHGPDRDADAAEHLLWSALTDINRITGNGAR
jgi:hypothetical protein